MASFGSWIEGMVGSSRHFYGRRSLGMRAVGAAPCEEPVVGPALGVPVHRAVRKEKLAWRWRFGRYQHEAVAF